MHDRADRLRRVVIEGEHAAGGGEHVRHRDHDDAGNHYDNCADQCTANDKCTADDRHTTADSGTGHSAGSDHQCRARAALGHAPFGYRRGPTGDRGRCEWIRRESRHGHRV